MERCRNLEKGQSLIEVLVGLTTAVIIVGAITAATVAALNNAVYSKNQTLATGYAQQALEIVRNLRDRDYQDFIKLNGNYCLAKGCDWIDPTGQDKSCGLKSIQCGQNYDIFIREVTVNQNDTNCEQNPTPTPGVVGIGVTASVSWYDAKCANASTTFCHSVQLSTCLSTYNSLPTQ